MTWVVPWFPPNLKTGIPLALPSLLHALHHPTEGDSRASTSTERTFIYNWCFGRFGRVLGLRVEAHQVQFYILLQEQLQWQGAPVSFSQEPDCCSRIGGRRVTNVWDPRGGYESCTVGYARKWIKTC